MSIKRKKNQSWARHLRRVLKRRENKRLRRWVKRGGMDR